MPSILSSAYRAFFPEHSLREILESYRKGLGLEEQEAESQEVREETHSYYQGILASLESYRKGLGLEEQEAESQEVREETHSYYQGILASLGNLKGFQTFVPQQDKNRTYVGRPLKEIRTLQEMPAFSYDEFVKRSSTIDVLWFNSRLMPNSFFEVEHSTDIQNSLLKYVDLQDFFVRMFIVADENRKAEFEQKRKYKAFEEISNRVNFLTYESLVKQYESEVVKASQEQRL